MLFSRHMRQEFPPLPIFGERTEVRGFDPPAQNPHPTLSLQKGEAIQHVQYEILR